MAVNDSDSDSDGGLQPAAADGTESSPSVAAGGNGRAKKHLAAVRFGYLRTVGEFKYNPSEARPGCGEPVVVQTNRGIEIGEVVTLTRTGCQQCVDPEQIRRYVEVSGPDYYNFGSGGILRLATDEDLADWERIRAETLRKKAFCQEQTNHHQLPMKVLECEHLFGGERIIFYFMAEGRVDFRALVRGLAEEFQTRIEMRQVGARDEARLLADYETCGRECCCRNFLKTLKPISMKMAKMQKATLDPAKVSGRCGRLKCCLRYEHTTYEELHRQLPSAGARIHTEAGSGTVVARHILTQLVQIQTDDGGRLTAPVESIIDAEEFARRQAAAAQAQERAAAAAQAEEKHRAKPSRPKRNTPGDREKPRRSRRSRRKPSASSAPKNAEAKGQERPPAAAGSQKPPPLPSGKGQPANAGSPANAGPPANAKAGKDGKGTPSKRRRRGRRSSRRRRSGKDEDTPPSSPPAS